MFPLKRRAASRQASRRHENAKKARDLPDRRTFRGIARPALSSPSAPVQLEAISDLQFAIERPLRHAAVRIHERDMGFHTRRTRSAFRKELRVHCHRPIRATFGLIGTPGYRRIEAESALTEMIPHEVMPRMSRMAYLFGPSVAVPNGSASQPDWQEVPSCCQDDRAKALRKRRKDGLRTVLREGVDPVTVLGGGRVRDGASAEALPRPPSVPGRPGCEMMVRMALA